MNARFLIIMLAVSCTCISSAENAGIEFDEIPVPWHFAHGFLKSDGDSGMLRIIGLSWDGRETELFRASPNQGGERLEFAFYLDDETRAIRIERASMRVELPVDVGTSSGTASADGAKRILLPADPPWHEPRIGRAGKLIDLDGSDLSSIAHEIAATRFTSPPAWASLVALLPAALLFIFLGLRIPGLDRRPMPKTIALGAILLVVSLATTQLMPGREELFAVGFPSADLGARLSGRLEYAQRKEAGYRIHAWGGEAFATLLGIRSGIGKPLPLDIVARKGDTFRFNEAPLVTIAGGRLCVSWKDFATGWRLGDAR